MQNLYPNHIIPRGLHGLQTSSTSTGESAQTTFSTATAACGTDEPRLAAFGEPKWRPRWRWRLVRTGFISRFNDLSYIIIRLKDHRIQERYRAWIEEKVRRCATDWINLSIVTRSWSTRKRTQQPRRRRMSWQERTLCDAFVSLSPVSIPGSEIRF
jgi:hypothetical protein